MVLQGKCLDYSSEGKGVVKALGKVIFVKGLFLNEEAKIELTYQGKDFCYGKIIELITKSPFRILPKCKVATACGGCSFQALAYSQELEFKQNKIQEALKRIGKIDHSIESIIPAINRFNYRNKVQVPLKQIKGQIVSGFYKEFTHDLVQVDHCYIESDLTNEIIKKVVQILNEFQFQAYNEDQGTGLFRHLLIRTNSKDEIMLVFVTTQDKIYGQQNLVKKIIEVCPKIVTIVNNINRRKTNVILGDKQVVLYGKGFIEETLRGLKFQIFPSSFFQINLPQTEILYAKVEELLKPQLNAVILDAYSGIGTIGLSLANKIKHLYSVENNLEAHQAALSSARLNHINNVSFIHEDATTYIKKLVSQNIKLDAIILDPPRKGTTTEFIEAVFALKPNKVLYVSCDPATLARDLALFKKQYQIITIIPVDLFPFTYHVETIVLLQKSK